MKTPIKIALALIPTGFAILAGWYVVDRMFIKKAPLYPFSLKKAQEKKANVALSIAKNKLNKLMEEDKIHGYGVVYDTDSKKNYIEVATLKITPQLKSEIPDKVNGTEIRIIERAMAKAIT